ncbi:ABC transporter permease [Methylobacterium sp. sgz302541]|uniref:ABC transporter permease n=1 Tax=unclassified Methylobacterium TaxID=2615210 RepID=UPI003D3342FF
MTASTQVPMVRTRAAAAETYLRVLHALMLRDMRTRFGGSHIGYAVVVFWPVVHTTLLVVIFVVRKMPPPVGDSAVLFVASGAVPFLMFQYISREVMKALVMNKPLTYYPQVKLVDVVFARILVEIVTGFLGLMIVFAALALLHVNPVPANPTLAMVGYLAAIVLGIGMGTINVAIVSFFPGWLMGYTLITMLMYMASGVFFLPNFLPDQYYEIMRWSPAVQIIECVRSGYYPELDVHIDYVYCYMWGLSCLAIGLGLERAVIRKQN